MKWQDHQITIQDNVATALREDIGDGDITAQLVPPNQIGKATIISRDHAIIAGSAWVNEVFRQVDPSISIDWQVNDGDRVQPNQVLFYLQGPARSLLSGERCALNFLQTLSGTATRCGYYADLVKQTSVKLLDTRKTLPGLRIAQKYAVSVGGCYNHRIGLYDAFLIKENHIAAAGSIAAAVQQARHIAASKPVEVEVENNQQLQQAIDAGVDIVMLDNYSPDAMKEAVAYTRKQSQAIKLEASGGINDTTLLSYAETGVDYISIGTLTKDCQSIDLSMRITEFS